MHTADLKTDGRYRLSPAVRLLPPGSFGNRQWLAVDLVAKRRLAIGRHAVALCVLAAGPTTLADAVRAVADYAGAGREELAKTFGTLLDQEILVAAEPSEQSRWVDELLAQWRAYGWAEAADHHLMTFDYPFHDYSADGWTQDRTLMRAYRDAEFDGGRYKAADRGPEAAGGPRAPRVTDVLPTLDAGLDELSGPPRRARTLDADALLRLMSVVFGVLESKGGGPGTAPFIRRTSPSGGARHPSEGYVCVFDVPGLEAGWYHYSCGDDALYKVADPDTERSGRALFGALRAPFPVRAVLVMTSVFGRNMYRYREPRTFRTLFMDVGHLLTTAEIAGRATGISVFGQHGIDDAYVGDVLRLAPDEEAPLLSVALGDGCPAPGSPSPERP
ncbi:dehydrogenase [Streptomyces longisporoflavus]|uniref:SagB/ThcOx family dehydrogenase n=1 Tax=Streptomyces longisporoflavus TaxID=28044 RepID=UPI00167DE7DF|nr:SagB/ThcOx family dehydrogenase [Streptomyces longisporoflavus]GGV29369.1 dehydrogenase [Streptomyces longisporoflavus]